MSTQAEKVRSFLALHQRGTPLLMANAWDAGSARILVSVGFKALATTSSGFAGTLGRLDGSVTREEAIQHAASIVAANDVPVSADLENCFGDSPEHVARTIEMAREAGVAGCSVEDFTGNQESPIYCLEHAVARVAAAANEAHKGPARLVLTARSENYLHGRPDLSDTIARLQAYQDAGADVLFAPGVSKLDDIRAIVDAVEKPVSVLALHGVPTVSELASAGVSRVSVGGGFFFAAMAATAEAGRELLERGTYEYLQHARKGSAAARNAFATERHANL